METAERQSLIRAIAAREGNAAELSARFGMPTEALRSFVAENRAEIAGYAAALADQTAPDDDEPDVSVLDELWITNKTERLRRYQVLADKLFREIEAGTYDGAELAMAVREYRSYCTVVANELGQLLHRGAGDSGTGDTLTSSVIGIDLDALK
jgi:hypothetical protein